jgi:NADPH-dependent ferric siderophore reductase
VLVAGDEAAVPAIRAIVAGLAVEPSVQVTVLVAAAVPADVLVPGAEHVPSLLGALDRSWNVDHAWIAAETAEVAEARRLLAGVADVQAQGYWTRGPRGTR